MVLTSSFSSQLKSSLARKIKIRQQIADSGRSNGENRGSATLSRLTMQQQQKQKQQQQPKVRKIAVVENSNNSSSSSSSTSSSGASAKQKRLPRNSILQHQSSSASAVARSVTRRAASPVLSQSGRRQLVVYNSENRINDKSQKVCIDRSSLLSSSSLEPTTAQSILKRSSSSSSLLANLEARGWRSLLQLRRQRRKTEPELVESLQRAKCVSFSADTIERQEDRQRPLNKHQPLHEAKLYRKGVLQDRRSAETTGKPNGGVKSNNNLPLSWEESLGGPRALLGAAHDADDELVQKIVNLANKVGLGNIQLNAQDNSGRTAISYLAGNGSALVLEACLSLDGVDANLPDNEGNTPLHFAAQAGQTECLNILLQRCPNIEVDARNNLGFTPLMKAGLQGRTKCAKILLFAGANPTLRDHGRGLRAEQWARFCGRYVCAEVIERFARHRLLEKTTSCRWGSEPELAAQVLQGKLMPVPSIPVQPPPSSGLKSKIRRVFRTTSNTDKTSFSLVSQLTSAALCASSPVLPKPGDVSPVVKSLLRPLSVPQLRITLVTTQDAIEKTSTEKCSHSTTFAEKIESTMVKPPRTKKKSK